ncbi:DgyrCDS12662 [Dimorphilus gyrociliatus]|uniref:DgyrCDS12662 n=1 Tax=Dimorphilus gyrociliatus TaxID=2664684 RepID=A0A7I8W817_9ANNE|nr:DgyrCDS12662 [Dimorphilus gyrociliatus]
MGRPGTGRGGGTSARPPGTASRLATGMAPGTSRGSVPAGGGLALNSQLKVTDRPMTKQGLSGMKTSAGARLNQRLVKDRTYFLGLLRTKIQELSAETLNLQREAEKTSENQASYVTYEKRAESLAAEIKQFQRELGDYNTLVDKLNTDESINDIQMDYEDLQIANNREAKVLDSLFEQKQKKQEQLSGLQLELQQEKSMAEQMVADMPAEMKKKYMKAKEVNEHMNKQLNIDQKEVDQLTLKRKELDEELAASPVKQEAVKLYEQLHELEEKRDHLISEANNTLSPQEEREKLLLKVKEDNQEIASMDRQKAEIKDRLANIHTELQQIDMDLEDSQGEKNQKYKELKKREETMDEFLNTFEDAKKQEIEKTGTVESTIVQLLNSISGDLQAYAHLPSANEFGAMKSDLDLKQGEMEKSKTTADNLMQVSQSLQTDLENVETLERKVTSELVSLKERISSMADELITFKDLDRLKREAEERKDKLQEDKISLHKRREALKILLTSVSQQYDMSKSAMNENETHMQLINLERKWQHLEQNNFVMKEFIASKSSETDARPILRRVNGMMKNYNNHLLESLGGKSQGM